MNKELDSIKNNFSKYLTNLGISPKSHKNYRSDLSHFSGWLILKIRSFGSYVENLTESVPFLSHNLSLEYKNYMLQNNMPIKTVNRRLSTLRHFSRFLVSSQIIDSNFMEDIENAVLVSEAKEVEVKNSRFSDHPSRYTLPIEEFRSYLQSEKVSDNTIKNYLSDIKQFMSWLESNQTIVNS